MTRPADYTTGPSFDVQAEIDRMAEEIRRFESDDNVLFRVELYNYWQPWRRFQDNGFYVAEIFRGCKIQQWDFKLDEQQARDFAARLNLLTEQATGLPTLEPAEYFRRYMQPGSRT